MEAHELKELAQNLKDHRQFITNEETTKMVLVVPFIRKLGFDPNNPREFRLEYTADFTKGDNKKIIDRIDYMIMGGDNKPLLAIEAKALGSDLRAQTNQLRRYFSQMSELRFGIMTDGAIYWFFSDLDSPNVMDDKPFFEFSLDDPKADFHKICKFLKGFEKGNFAADRLITDAENERYKHGMIVRLTAALKDPTKDDLFLNWITSDYKGKRTQRVMERLTEVAKEAIEPAISNMISDDFIEKLRDKIKAPAPVDELAVETKQPSDEKQLTNQNSQKIITTEEELAVFEAVRKMLIENGASADDIIYTDTQPYFSIFYKKSRDWIVRFVSRRKEKHFYLRLPPEECVDLPPGAALEINQQFGPSKITLENIGQIDLIKKHILRSFELVKI